MRQPMMLIALSALGACASPLPPVDPKQAWVDLYTMTPGRVIMADRLDGIEEQLARAEPGPPVVGGRDHVASPSVAAVMAVSRATTSRAV